jgi:hypothetical protein
MGIVFTSPHKFAQKNDTRAAPLPELCVGGPSLAESARERCRRRPQGSACAPEAGVRQDIKKAPARTGATARRQGDGGVGGERRRSIPSTMCRRVRSRPRIKRHRPLATCRRRSVLGIRRVGAPERILLRTQDRNTAARGASQETRSSLAFVPRRPTPPEGHMDRFVRRENIRHYRDLLKRVTDEAERRRILRLLEEEHQKQIEAGDPPEDERQAE